MFDTVISGFFLHLNASNFAELLTFRLSIILTSVQRNEKYRTLLQTSHFFAMGHYKYIGYVTVSKFKQLKRGLGPSLVILIV